MRALALFLAGLTALALTGAQAAEPVLALQTAPDIATLTAPTIVSADAISGSSAITSIDHTVQGEDLWARMRAGFAMQNLDTPLVDDRVRYYLAHPQGLVVMLERSRKYLYHIVTELEKRGMPTELALLPVVESAFNPLAQSPARAAGLWQFIPSTGKDFALTQNWWVDQRRDIVASTDAALQYLQALYEMHGDWQLALASYNWGENAVARAIATNRAAGKPTDFVHLRMPTETRYYVPKLQAIKNIIEHPEQYHVALPDIPNQPYFVTVEREQGMDLTIAAKLAEIPIADFLQLNPGYNRPVMPGSAVSRIVLPVENARKFQENLASHDAPLVTWKTWTVPHTSRIEQIAKQLGLTVQALCSANGLRARALLAAGYTLLVPSSQSEPMPSALAKAAAAASAKPVAHRSRAARHSRRRG